MKSIILMALAAAAAFYAYTSWPQATERLESGQPHAARSGMGNPVREIERAPNTLIEMRGAMGSANAGAAHAARKAVTDTLGK